MFRWRRWLLFGSATLLVVLVLWYSLGHNPHGDVWERYAQIREGMSKAEVVALFGVPPGRYNSGRVALCGTGQEEMIAAVDKCNSKDVWLFDEGLFEIGFDKDLKVEKKLASANMGGRPTVYNRLRLALGF